MKSEKEIFETVEANGNEPPTLVIVDLNNLAIKPMQIDHEAEGEVQEADECDRIPVAYTSRTEVEGARGGLRYGAATVVLLGEPAAVVEETCGRRRRLGRSRAVIAHPEVGEPLGRGAFSLFAIVRH